MGRLRELKPGWPQHRASALLDRQRAVIVAMVSVRMMQVAANQVIGVVPMRDCLFALVVAGARDGRAPFRVRGIYRDGVLVVMALVRRVQMPLVQVIKMPFVAHAWMAALFVVDMRVVAVGLVAFMDHMLSPSSEATRSQPPPSGS